MRILKWIAYKGLIDTLGTGPKLPAQRTIIEKSEFFNSQRNLCQKQRGSRALIRLHTKMKAKYVAKGPF